MTEIINNINQQEGLDFDDIQHPFHTDLITQYILAYRKYQSNLYKQIFGIHALESLNIEQFKESLTEFEPKRLNILKCYLFAKSFNMNRANGDEFLQIIRDLFHQAVLIYVYLNHESLLLVHLVSKQNFFQQI